MSPIPSLITVILVFIPFGYILTEPGEWFYQLSRLTALVGTVLFTLSLAFGMRFKWLEQQMGQDRLIKWHHAFGLAAFILVLLHGVYSVITYGQSSFRSFGILLGVAALIIFVLMIGSIWIYRAGFSKYEGWRSLHFTNYFIFLLAYTHSFFVGRIIQNNLFLLTEWALVGIIFLLSVIHRINLLLHIRRHPYKIDHVKQETHDVWSLEIEGDPISFLPGQYLYLQLLKTGRASMAHPFTIASSPTQDMITLSIKTVGDFTREIVTLRPNDQVLLDGPYGRFSYLNFESNSDKSLIFIAGGIGITPFLSMLRYLFDHNSNRNTWLIWGNKTENDIAFQDELAVMQKKLRNLRIVHVLSDEKKPGFENGFIDADKTREILGELDNKAYFICGPPIMMKQIINGLIGKKVPKRDIYWEDFSI